PGIRHFNALANLAHRWQDTRPKAECAIDMNPRTRAVRVLANFADWIDGSGIYVAGLGDDQGCFVQFGHLIGSHASLIVHRNELDVFGSESQHRNRLMYGCVRIGAGDNANFWRAVKAVAGNVPAASTKQFVATGTHA